MLPEIRNNSYILTKKYNSYKVNDIVAIKAKDIGMVVKKIKHIEGDFFIVESINKQYDSIVSKMIFEDTDIIGKVIFKLFN